MNAELNCVSTSKKVIRFRPHLFLALFAIVPSLFQSIAVGQNAQSSVDFFRASALRNVKIASQEAGIVRKLLVKEGSTVDAKQPLVELNRKLFELDLVRSEAELKIAELEKSSDADRLFAEENVRFYDVLLARYVSANKDFARAVSDTELKQAGLELEKSKLSLKQALLQERIAKEKSLSRKSEFETAGHRLKLRTISSALKGTVVEILVEEGEWVQAGQPIARVVDYTKLKVKGYVPAEQFSVSDVGKKIQFQAVKPRVQGDPKFEATITFVSPEIEPKFFTNPKVRIIAEMDNPNLQLRINSEMRLVQ